MWLLNDKKDDLSNTQDVLNCIDGVKRSSEVYHETFALQSMHRMSELLSSADENMIETTGIISQYLPQILSMYMESKQIIFYSVDVLSYLSHNETNATKLGKVTCDLLVTILKTYIGHADLVAIACKCVKFLGEFEVNERHFTTNDICDALTSILRMYGASNDPVAEWGCKAIFIVARRSSKNQQKLGMTTCELLVENILKSEVHKNSHSVKAAVAAAVGALATNNTHNKKYFMDSGACWIILKLLEFTQTNGQDYCTACCYCISNIADSDSNLQYQFHNWDATHSVLTSLKANMHTGHSCVQCFRALRSLSHDNVLVRSSLLSLHALDNIIAAINLHSNSAVVAEWGWSFISSLAEYKPAVEQLVAAGVLEAMVDAFTSMSEYSDVVMYLSQSLSKLGRELAVSERIQDVPLCVHIVRCVNIHVADAFVTEEACNAIGTIAGLSAINRKTLVEGDALGSVVKALYSHERKAAVVEQCAYAIANLSIDLPASRFHSIAFKSVSKVLSQHKSVPGVVLWALIATTRLCEDDTQMSRLLVSPAAIIGIMSHFGSNAEMITWGLRATLGLLPPAENALRFSNAGISACIVQIVSSHNDDDAIIELALIIIAVLSSNETINSQLSKLGICDLISLSLQTFKTSEIAAINGCKSIARLAFSSAENADKFLDADIVAVLCSLMDFHFEVESALVAATYALSGLALVSNRAKKSLSQNHFVLDLTVKALRISHSPELSTACCAILARLSADDEACKRYLGDHGACEDVLAALMKAVDDPTLCREACYAIYRMCDQFPENVVAFNETICSAFTDVLTKHAFLPVVCERCLTAMTTLLHRTDLIVGFGACGLCAVIVNLLKINLKNEIVVEKILKLICSLSPLNSRFGEAGGCNGILSALVTHASMPSIAQWACCAITSMCDDDTNKATFGALQTCEAVVGLLSNYVDNNMIYRAVMTSPGETAGASMWACKAIYALGNRNKGHQTVLGNAGACDLVAKALALHKNDEDVSIACCMAATTLSEYNLEHKLALGEAGICAEIVDVLRVHVANQELATWAMRATALLALETDNNIVKLIAAGACETIPVSMQAHQRVECIVGAGCSIIASLASNFATAGRLGHNGAVEAIVSALDLHSTSPLVVSKGSLAISRLAQSVGNTSWLGPAGACEALLAAIQKHADDEMVSYEAWYAVGSAAVDMNNCIRFGAAGACEMVVAALIMHPESELIVQSASRAVGKLSKHPQNAAIIHSSGDCDVIINSFRSHKANELAALQMCTTLSILAFGDKNLQIRLGVLGANELVADALQLHRNSASFVNQGLLAVKSLAYQNEENQKLLRESNVCSLILEILQLHIEDIAVNQSACWAISNLCAGNDSNIFLFGSLGACEAVIKTLSMFPSDETVCQYSSSALYHLTVINDDSCNKCSFSGAADALVLAAFNHQEDIFIAENILQTMLRMCFNSIGRHKLGAAGVCKAVFTSFIRFEHKQKIMSLILNLIFSMSLENTDNQIKFIENGAFRSILYWLNMYIEIETAANAGEVRASPRRKMSRKASRDYGFYVGNVSKAFKVDTNILDDACLAIASLSEGYEESKRRITEEGSSTLMAVIRKMSSSLDSSDLILEHAKKHIKGKIEEDGGEAEIVEKRISRSPAGLLRSDSGNFAVDGSDSTNESDHEEVIDRLSDLCGHTDATSVEVSSDDQKYPSIDSQDSSSSKIDSVRGRQNETMLKSLLQDGTQSSESENSTDDVVIIDSFINKLDSMQISSGSSDR